MQIVIMIVNLHLNHNTPRSYDMSVFCINLVTVKINLTLLGLLAAVVFVEVAFAESEAFGCNF